MNLIWSEILEMIRNRVDPYLFNTWFEQIQIEKLKENELTLKVPDGYFEKWICDNYLDMIRECIWNKTRKNIKVVFVHDEKSADRENIKIQGYAGGNGNNNGDRNSMYGLSNYELLIERFSFDNFVTGASNQFACSASRYVSENPAKGYNPLFIYGGVGLGKTHLIQAVGHNIKSRFAGHRILYIQAASFVNEVMSAVRNNMMDSLRYKYRGQCDIFLVDDIQYLNKSEFAQEEFFHTFNFLHGSNKQIVLTSDQYPNDIPKIQERLKSRFQWGLITDIAPPEFETRIEIVKTKARRDGVSIPDSVAHLIAEKFNSNVRELEGALNRIAAYAMIKSIPITLELTREVIKKISMDRVGRITHDLILKKLAEYFNLKVADLVSKRRHRAVSIPRHVAMYLIRKHTNHSLPEIGEFLGGRDHSTVITAINKITSLQKEDPLIERTLKDIERSLGV